MDGWVLGSVLWPVLVSVEGLLFSSDGRVDGSVGDLVLSSVLQLVLRSVDAVVLRPVCVSVLSSSVVVPIISEVCLVVGLGWSFWWWWWRWLAAWLSVLKYRDDS